MESKIEVNDVGENQKRDKAKAPISPDPEPGMEASNSNVVQDDEDKENASLNSNGQAPKATTGREVACEAALPDSEPGEAIESPMKVTAYFNELSAYLVRNRVSVDVYWAIRNKLDEVLEKCGY